MLRTLFAVAISSLVAMPDVTAAASGPDHLCEAAKLKAASAFAQCRGKADSAHAKSPDPVKREAAHVKCADALAKGYGTAERKYGPECPTTGDADAVSRYLSQCTDDVDDSVRPGGTVPDYVAEIDACNLLLSSLQSSLASVTAGTATEADVFRGKTFSSIAGIGLTGTAYRNALVGTGQVTAYGPGSDADLQSGPAPSFTDNGDGTVTDARTGLTWEKKSDDGSIHDWNNSYSWGQNTAPYSMNGTMVTTFLASLNTPPCFAGHCDWRIPNRTELLSITNIEFFSPATSTAFNNGCAPGCTVSSCSCTRSGSYWTSSTNRTSPDTGWVVLFSSGTASNGTLKTGSVYVRAVRSDG